MSDGRAPILYIAPWVDRGDMGIATIDWFKRLDRTRWAPSLITTTPSPNCLLHEVEAHAEEIWNLPDLMPGGAFPEFILGFVESRAVRVVHIMNSRLAFDLLPDMTCLPEPPAVVGELRPDESDRVDYVRYVTRRYGNLIDAFVVAGGDLERRVVDQEIPPSRIERVEQSPPGEAGDRDDGLYERLLAERVASSRWRNEELFGEGDPGREELGGPPPSLLRLGRDPLPERTVGVVVPCYRHGIFLDACIASVKAQTHRPAAIVVVDDASTDPETVEALACLDEDPDVTVLRQPRNSGPSAARNRAIEHLDTGYVLPIDADDELLPDALERMLAQLEAAPGEVGFVYPSWRHIGNQSEEVHPPTYNLWLLMEGNYCAAPALFDRRLFAEGGIRYAEEIVVGHEDWDLILQLAESGVQGIPAAEPTFLYRRQGFSRVNAVDYGPDAFERTIDGRHPHLYRNRDAIKARWAPALSIVLFDESAGAWRGEDLSGLDHQTCLDFEALARTRLGEGVRPFGDEAIPDSPGVSLQAAIDTARGRWVLLLPRSGAAVLDVPSFVEQVLHSFAANEGALGLVLADASDLSRAFFGQLDNSERLTAHPGAVAFERSLWGRAPEIPLGVEDSPLADLAVGLRSIGPVQWRAAPVGKQGTPWLTYPPGGNDDTGQIDINLPGCEDSSEAAMRHMVVHQTPRLPELTPGTVRRWKHSEPWTPPQTQLLYRFVDPHTQIRLVLPDEHPPPGYVLDRILGSTHLVSLPGTKRLVHANHSFEVVDRQGKLVEGEYGMGYIEQEPIVLMDRLELRRVSATGQETLVAGEDDPLLRDSEPVRTLGWIEACPILPRAGDVLHTGPWAVVSLRREADAAGWRHSYRVGAVDEGLDGVDLGSLRRYPGPELVAVRLRPDGRLDSDLCVPGRASRDPRKIARWIGEPFRGRGSTRGAKGLASRVRHLGRHHRARRLSEGGGETLGYLQRQNVAGSSTLYSTIHPVTGDQLVTRFPQEATEAGYVMDGILGAIFDPPNGDAARGAEPVTADEGRQAAVCNDRGPVLYLRPGVDEDALASATVNSFARLDSARWAPHLIIAEPSPNRRLHRIEPLAEEILNLPEQTAGVAFPELILSFLESRHIGLLSVAGSRLGFDLLPDVVGLADPPAVVVHFADGEPSDYVDYVTGRYGDLVDAFLVSDERTKQTVSGNEIPPSRIEIVPSDPEDASTHQGELFERLLASRRVGASQGAARADGKAADAPVGASPRLLRDQPLERTVSVAVPCFRHGIYLDACIDSIKLQLLRPQHIVIVDDGSDDLETLEALERWEADPSITVLRQPENLGPSAARNRALDVFDTNYALWIDADDQLLPGALDSMIAKLEQAPEDVGFVYPHAKHMGSRSDYVETPAYNLRLLMQRDVCLAPSMYDMRVFEETGVSFSEDMVAGHESWDLTLQLAERGIVGQPADGPTFLYRKRGFSRFQALDRGRDPRRAVEARHPALYLNADDVQAERRSDDATGWMPPGTQLLCRHLHLDESMRVITNDRNPPPGFRLEFDLGVTHAFALPGTRRLVARAGTFELSDERDQLTEGLGLGYIEDRPFPLCECLELCEVPESGERVLVAGPEDPLYGVARPIALLGWVQAFPLQPRGNLPRDGSARAVALYRRLDDEFGRHRYAAGLPEGESPSVVIGSLFSSPGGDGVALRLLDDGRLATGLATAGHPTRDPRKLARWVLKSPASDTGPYRSPTARARSLARHRLARRSRDDRGLTLGWLKGEGSPGVRPLFSATHPVTGDQLVTPNPQEASAYGYAFDGILGYVSF